MKLLYIGDIMAEPGQEAVTQLLPGLKDELAIDFVVAQSENISPDGKGPGLLEIRSMQSAGVDFFTGGNHSLRGQNSPALFADDDAPVIRPANMRDLTGHGYKVVSTTFGKILIVSMLGQTVGRPIPNVENPLTSIDAILQDFSSEQFIAIIVNFHGDFSSEKRVYGYYLDGRVSAVVGDHWHVPTADASILPNGTAHITDVGMCGTLHSSLGVKTAVISERWKTGSPSRNEIELDGPLQFNAVLIDIDETSGLSRSIELIQRMLTR